MATQAVQLNVRMDRALRDAGNAALAQEGWSPTEFIRAAWKKLAQRGPSSQALLKDVCEDAPSAVRQDSPADDMTDPWDRADLLVERYLNHVGASRAQIVPAPSIPWKEELEQGLVMQLMEQEGLLQPDQSPNAIADGTQPW